MTSQQEHPLCHLVETDTITFLFIVYRYDSTTGTFTVPPGGDGYYYFSVYLLVDSDEWGRFNIEINGQILCTAQTYQLETTNGEGQAACSAAFYATEGKQKLFCFYC